VDKNKEVQERTEWHSVIVWGARAEGLAKLLAKGTCVLVEGGLRTSSYEKDGVKRYKTEIHASEICLTGRRIAVDGPALAMAAPRPSAPRKPARTAAPAATDELPF
jgi:single-strand DNA-binding protein